ncbi:hypothetical protein FHETE_7591 [Fusarium heterosporum]|uniref:Uncharacterized protein n=1 Tax=Fusarium heterosporum TaxID=42747 RepID=A0A8H5WKG3_FUSHE|nr:hypothetical protein FHETE_7591 [Fusarium heterosporum]
MHRYTKACAGRLWNSRPTLDGQQRWTSYTKAALERDAILEQIESELGRMRNGKRVKVNPESRTIKTDAGELPISPMMDPNWISKRRRHEKAVPSKISGVFRKKLSNNPYAQALMTPMRWCKNTNTILPRYFLQDFELVEHPDPKQTNPWFAPGPLSFESVMPWHSNDDHEHGSKVGRDQTADSGKQPQETPKKHTSTTLEVDAQAESIEKASAILEGEREPEVEAAAAGQARKEDEVTIYEVNGERRLRRAPHVSYALARKSVINMIGRRKAYQSRMSFRMGMASLRPPGQKIFRPDMGDVLLKMLRRQAVDALIARSDRQGKQPEKFISAVKSWEEAKTHGGGCILYIPKEDMEDINSYATLDVENVNYGNKIAVHDLIYLLGEEEVNRLKMESNLFKEHEILVLENYRSLSMRTLHMLLWRLQGYLAVPTVEVIEGRQY